MFTEATFNKINLAISTLSSNSEHDFKLTINKIPIKFTKLYGDASCKEFYRFNFQDNHYILVKIPVPAPASEETFIPEIKNITQGDIFLETSLWLSKSISNTPTLYAHNKTNQLFIINNAGDTTLFDITQSSTPNYSQLKEIYFKSIDWIIQLQSLATPSNNIIAARQFNEASLYTELAEFIKYTSTENTPPKSFNQDYLVDLARQVAKQAQTIIHRDFQSKNILLSTSSFTVIDSQDMCLGPQHYDLASLLYDPYVDLPQQLIEQCQQYYWHVIKDKINGIENFNDFQNLLHLTAIQRLLKAAGRYQRINVLKNNSSYLPFYKIAINRAFQLAHLCKKKK